MKISHLLGATALAGSLTLSPAAFAQTAPTDQSSQPGTPPGADGVCPPNTPADPDCVEQAAGDTSETILVTGTRIAGATALDSPVPITSLTAAELIDDGNLSLGDTLNQLPSLRSTFSQANSTRSIGTAGLNLLDLRGLGTDRTLVLVNGRRHVTAVPGSYNVDVNTIPNALIEAVDVITGGTSAVYGSDAIAGVVNFKLKRDYDGVEAKLQAGVSERGDRGSYLASIVAGKNFADGRGNIAVSAEYAHSNSVLFSDRNEQTGAYTGVPGFFTQEPTSQLINGVLVNEPPEGDGIPDQRYFSAYPGSVFGNVALGGAISPTCPNLIGIPTALTLARRAAVCTGQFSQTTANIEFADTYVFTDNGVLTRDRPTLDLRYAGGGRFGGLTASGVEGAMLLPGLERINTNVLFNYEFSPALRFYAEGKYVHVTNNQTSTQPTFTSGTLSSTFFLDNPFLTPQNQATIQTLLGTTSTTANFSMVRFNNDIGTRAEDHKRETYRFVAGFDGQLSEKGNLAYDVALNYGRTNTYYETGGNVDVAKFNAAANVKLAPTDYTGTTFQNQTGARIACAVNVDRLPATQTNPNPGFNTANDMAGCVPLNLFGQYQASREAINYVLYTSSRNQWAEEMNAVASISGDSSGVFSLPAGDVGFALGAEYRREDAFSDYDDFTQGGNTFLNAISQFDPPAVDVYEGFGEIRVPILKDMLFKEVTLTGAGRYSKYSSMDKGVWAYNAGLTIAPVDDIRFRVGYAKSVRAPNLSDLYATRSQTFANNFVDPCNQGATITANPNRVRNCAAAGVPTTLTYTDDQGTVRTVPFTNTLPSGLSGFNQGNINLLPETGKSLTVGAVFQPRFLPGFSLTVDYYRIKVSNVISGLSGQGIVDRCYDDPVGIDNPFCKAVFRRTSTDPIQNATFAGQNGRRLAGVAQDIAFPTTGPGFLNQPFNYAKLKTSGIDADIRYNHTFDNGVRFGYRAIVSWLENRESFLFITAPEQSTRAHGVVGDPIWRGRMSVNLAYKGFDIGYDLNYIGKGSIFSWETQHTHQGRGPTNLDVLGFRAYPAQDTHDIQLGYRVNKQFRAYFGVDNLADTLPPYGATGTGAASGIYSVVGRYFYSGVNLNF